MGIAGTHGGQEMLRNFFVASHYCMSIPVAVAAF
jgi:hypothetical protein